MQTLITNPDLAIAGATAQGFEKTWRPSRRWNLGLEAGNTSNQIQQVKSAAITSSAGNTANNQGQAKPVQNLRVVRMPVGNNQIRVSVSFTPDPSDRYFQGVAVHLGLGINNPLQVAFGKESPIVFTVDRTSAPAAISAQSIGSFADSDLNSSPTRAVTLRS